MLSIVGGAWYLWPTATTICYVWAAALVEVRILLYKTKRPIGQRQLTPCTIGCYIAVVNSVYCSERTHSRHRYALLKALLQNRLQPTAKAARNNPGGGNAATPPCNDGPAPRTPYRISSWCTESGDPTAVAMAWKDCEGEDQKSVTSCYQVIIELCLLLCGSQR